MEIKYLVYVVLAYLLLMNLIGFFGMGVDKRKARKHKWRIPEARLFLVSLIGGSIGSLLGMIAFRHKTKHAKFVIGMPAILILHIVLVVVIGNHWWQL